MFLGGLEMVIQSQESPAVIDDPMPEGIWRCIRLIPGGGASHVL